MIISLKKISFMFILSMYTILPLFTIAENHEWISKESEHFIIYYKENYFTDKEVLEIIEKQEKAYNFATSFLNLEFEDKISYYFYTLEDGFPLLVASSDPQSKTVFIPLIASKDDDWEGDAHELTHVISYNKMGSTIKLFDEGLASVIDIKFKNKIYFIQQWNKAFLVYKKYIPIQELIDNKTFESYQFFGYFEGSSFSAFLIEIYGIEKFKILWGEVPFNAKIKKVNEAMLKIYDKPINTLETEWKKNLMNFDVKLEYDFSKGIFLANEYDKIFNLYNQLLILPFTTYSVKIENERYLFGKAFYEGNFNKAEKHFNNFKELIDKWDRAREKFINSIEIFDVGNYDEVISILKEAETLYGEVEDKKMKQNCKRYIDAFLFLKNGKNYFEEKNYSMAKENFSMAREIFEELEDKEMIEIANKWIERCDEKLKINLVRNFSIFSIVLILGFAILIFKSIKIIKKRL